MHICVIGDGAAGLMAANFFTSKEYVKELTVIGSPKIPTIGVGESTTLNFEFLHKTFDSDFDSFIRESDACVKLGVLYSNWSKREFLHHFKMPSLYNKYNLSAIEYSNSLGNKGEDVYIHDLIGNKLLRDAKNNQIPIHASDSYYGRSWHFDAGKYITYLKKLIGKKDLVNIVNDTVVKCNFKDQGEIESIILESNSVITADYFIVCTGNNSKTSEIFDIEYKDLSNVLLTDKALFFPKKYKNKEFHFHPYTIAKTMKNGWRWITPTWSRIGTGYAFSSKYISVEDAIKELRDDVGDETISPHTVDFQPKYNQNTFRKNYMTLGMCNGFLEPLDAPGLAISCILTMVLGTVLSQEENVHNIKNKIFDVDYQSKLNKFVEELYNGWAAFILTQYKMSTRNDTDFWRDHKNVQFEYLDQILENLNNEVKPQELCDINNFDFLIDMINKDIVMMLQQTISSRDVRWKTNSNIIPYKLDDSDYTSINHYEYISKIHST